jgi:hypothetical protein
VTKRLEPPAVLDGVAGIIDTQHQYLRRQSLRLEFVFSE